MITNAKNICNYNTNVYLKYIVLYSRKKHLLIFNKKKRKVALKEKNQNKGYC